jgi:hypothetical protein
VVRRAAFSALIGVAVLGSCTHGSPSPSSHRLNGEYAVHGVYPNSQPLTNGAPCNAIEVGYRDIHPGTPVVVRNSSGAAIGTATLGSGDLRLTGSRRNDCVYTFSLRVPDASQYQIEVSNRGLVSFSRADMVKAHWKAELRIGNYTLGT